MKNRVERARRRGFRAALVAVWALCFAYVAGATPSISSLSVRQQWPWSANINVYFHLVNNEATPVDVSIALTNGTAGVAVPSRAVTGPRIGLTATGDYRLVIDPTRLAPGGTVLGDLSVTLTLTTSREDADFPLYRVYDLVAKTRTDVTVKALLNGEWGDIETDYAFVDGPYRPDDVLIWTGVTNNPAYKTNCFVMRYVPAGTYTMFAQQKPPGTGMTLTQPFYIGVFEMTQGQCGILSPTRASAYFTNATYAAMRPMGSVSLKDVRGQNSVDWPTGLPAPGMETTYIGRLRTYFGDSSFDLPTSARWEYAARAGCGARWYNGITNNSGVFVSETAPRLCRYRNDGGIVNDTIPDWDAPPENGTAIVGSYLPNAWGLYDCIGNVAELCLDQHAPESTVVANGPYTDWLGIETNAIRHVVRGGSYVNTASELHVDYYTNAEYNKNYAIYGKDYDHKDTLGFRVVCDAVAAPARSEPVTLATATAAAEGAVVLRPEASPFWRTVSATAPVTVPVDWPAGAASATCVLTAYGHAVASASATRVGNESGTTLSFELPVPTVPDEERVYAAELTFTDGNDVALPSDTTQRAQLAVVLGQGNGAAVDVRAPDGEQWGKYKGSHVTLPVDAGVSSLSIDGVSVDPGLDGAVGWYGTILRTGTHVLATDVDGEQSVFIKGLGRTVIFR